MVKVVSNGHCPVSKKDDSTGSPPFATMPPLLSGNVQATERRPSSPIGGSPTSSAASPAVKSSTENAVISGPLVTAIGSSRATIVPTTDSMSNIEAPVAGRTGTAAAPGCECTSSATSVRSGHQEDTAGSYDCESPTRPECP